MVILPNPIISLSCKCTF